MLRRLRRNYKRIVKKSQSAVALTGKSQLNLENLERRLLLDTAGWWDELGWRGASGGGVSWDISSDPAETQMISTSDGDPVVFWTEGTLQELVPTPEHYHTEMSGPIYARQYGGANMGWWDLSEGSGDTNAIGNGSQLDAAAGPNGEIALAWVSGGNVDVRIWDGTRWGATQQFGGGHSSKPSVAISDTGEIYVSFTALETTSNQTDILVYKYGYSYTADQQGGPTAGDLSWTELVDAGVDTFGTPGQLTGGVSNDTGQSYDSSIAVDNTGKPVVVWTNVWREGNTEIYARRWDGDSWEEIGLGSTSDINGDGNSGISDDAGMSLQPDVAVGGNGDVVVTWVNWNNWSHYSTDGQAGVYVKVLHSNSQVWEPYATGSTTGAGIAQDSNLVDGMAGQGWYYSPSIKMDSQSQPFIVWQGYGAGERLTADRDNNGVNESPMTAVYASHYENTAFHLLYDPDNVNIDGDARGTANDAGHIAWMPSGVVTENDKLVMGYTWHDEVVDTDHHDDEIFVQSWDATNSTWDEFGRGAMSNGNDIVGGFPNASEDTDIKTGLIYYSGNSEPDYMAAVQNTGMVNGGTVYLYNRQTDKWTGSTLDETTGNWDNATAVSDIHFGAVYDLKGQADIEYGVQGAPILAYLDDNTLLPYVYQWSGGGWALVGNGAASTTAGNPWQPDNVPADRDHPNFGISVQAGPNGQILLAYVVSNGVSDDVVTRLWDPNTATWKNAGSTGILSKRGALSPVYYAKYDCYDWDKTGDLSDGKLYDSGPHQGERNYESVNTWYFWPLENGDMIKGEVRKASGSVAKGDYKAGAGMSDSDWVDKDGNLLTGGVELTVDIPASNNPPQPGDVAAAAGNRVSGEVDEQMQIISEGYLDIQLSYAMNTWGKWDDATNPMQNVDLALYLVIDGDVVDTDPSTTYTATQADPYPVGLDPIVSADAGTMIPYSNATNIKLDTKDMGLDPLAQGVHTVGFRLVATVNSTADPLAEQIGEARLDNVAIYQRVVPETRLAGDDPAGNDNSFNFSTDPALAAGTPAVNNWGYSDIFDPGAVVSGAWSANGGPLSQGVDPVIADDGALVMTLGDGVNANGVDTDGTALAGKFEYKFNLADPADVRVDFSYDLQTGAAIGATDTLSLIVAIDGTDLNTDTYQITGPEGDSYWQQVSLDVSSLTGGGQYAAGDHVLSIRGVLTNSAASADGTATVSIDDVTVNSNWSFDADPGLVVAPPNAGEWSYEDGTDPDGSVDGLWAADGGRAGAAPDGALVMTLADSASAAQTGVTGEFAYGFTLTESRYVTLDMSYFMGLDANVTTSDFLMMMVGVTNTDTSTVVYASPMGDCLVRGTAGVDDNGVLVPGRALDTGWRDIKEMPIGVLPAGNYVLEIAGDLSDFEASNASWNGFDDALGSATLKIEDVQLNYYTGYGKWESIGSGGDIGGNDEVGRTTAITAQYPNGTPLYNFHEDIHSHVIATAGTEAVLYNVEDVTQGSSGPMTVLFRYRVGEGYDSTTGLMAPLANGTIRVLIDGVAYDSADTANRPFPTDWANSVDWYNDNPQQPDYTWVRIDADSIPAGTHTVTIELTGTGVSTDLWIDNLTILASQPVNSIHPIATLVATGPGDGTRNFAVGVTNEAPTLSVYANADDVWPDGTVTSYAGSRKLFGDAYYSANVFELDQVNNQWTVYGDDINAGTQNIDFLGFGAGDASIPMAGSGMVRLDDLVIGPNQVEWIALQHGTSDWVDTDGDGVKDEFDIHPWVMNNAPAYWNVETTDLDLQVEKWNPFQPTPFNPAWSPSWVDTGFAPVEPADHYVNIQMTSSPNQNPTVAWTQESVHGSTFDSNARHYEGNGVWGILGPSEDVQDNQYWSSLWLDDMVAGPDGSPVVAFDMGHLGSLGFREFKKAANIPSMTITENSGQANDNVLEFGVAADDIVYQQFTVSNAGPGDLYIYDVTIGGLGDLTNNPFSIWPQSSDTFPIIIKSGGQQLITVRFDPANVPAGKYDGVLLVHSNATTHPSHPFGHFYEMDLNVTVENKAELYISNDDQWLVFDNTVINGAGVNNLEGGYKHSFTISKPEDVTLDLSYRLMLGSALNNGQTLDLVVNVDGKDVNAAGTYRITGGTLQDSGYLSISDLDLGTLTAGRHVLTIDGELSASLARAGGSAAVRLDDITLKSNGVALTNETFTFDSDPTFGYSGNWSFVADSTTPDFTSGAWDANAGVTGSSDGALVISLGKAPESKEVEIANNGTANLTIKQWVFDSSIFRVESQATDGVVGAFVTWHDASGAAHVRNVSSVNNRGSADDVVLAPGEVLTLKIVFEPVQEGTADQTLYIYSDDTTQPELAVRLTGVGSSGSDIFVDLVKTNGVDLANPVRLYDAQSDIDFGSVLRGSSATETIRITNSGTSDLTISGIAPGNSLISVLPSITEPIVLAPGEYKDFNVTFSPLPDDTAAATDITPLTNSVLVISNDTDDIALKQFEINLTGMAVGPAPVMSLIDTDTNESLSPARLDFGSVFVGQSINKTFQINNIGGANMELEGFVLAPNSSYIVSPANKHNDDSDDITLGHGLGTDTEQTITVTFAPNRTGTIQDNLIIYYYDENHDLQQSSVVLVGSGTGQQLLVTDDASNVIPDGGNLNFDSVVVNQTSEHNLVLKNVGNSALTITQWSSAAGVFSLVSPTVANPAGAVGDVVLQPGATETLVFSFTPNATGTFTDDITISTDDPHSSSWTVHLVGDGVLPQGNISPNALDFGTVTIGDRVTKSFTISNNGTGELQVTSIVSSSPYFILDTTTLANNHNLIAPNSAVEVPVTFAPPMLFDGTATVTVTTSDVDGGNSVTLPAISLTGLAEYHGSTDIQGKARTKWIDGNGNSVQIIVSGPGRAVVTSVGGGLTGDIEKIELFDTTAKSSLVVKGPKAGTVIGQITGGEIKNVTLKNVTINGDMNNDGVDDNDNAVEFAGLYGSLKLGDVTGGADIHIGNTTALKGPNIKAGTFGANSDVKVDDDLTSFQVYGFGNGSIRAQSIVNFKVKEGDFAGKVNVAESIRSVNIGGKVNADITGDFIVGDDIGRFNARKDTFKGYISADNIGSVTVGGMNGAAISVRGELKNLSANRDVVDSLILAGYDLGPNGKLDGIGNAGSDDVAYANGKLNNVKINGNFENSYLASGISPVLKAGHSDITRITNGYYADFFDVPANNLKVGTIGKVRFGSVTANNGGVSFGVVSHSALSQVQVGTQKVFPNKLTSWYQDDDFLVRML